VKTGGQLGYATDLRRAKKWPPDRRRGRDDDKDHPVATAYLVVPFDPADAGARPIADARVLHNAAVTLRNAAGTAVDRPVAGETYAIEAVVANRGVAGAYFGLADFYVADAAAIDTAAAGGAVPPALGRGGFTVNGQAATIARCPATWSPASDVEAAQTVVVHAYDPTSDALLAPFDAHADRHVGRRDPIADFAGVWNGSYSTNWGPGSFVARLVITQTGLAVSAGFYLQVGGPGQLPANPQWTGTGTVAGDAVSGFTIEDNGGAPFTSNQWTLTLTGPDALHLDNLETFIAPGDTRPPQTWSGDLTR
jgi:hypothetical protein